MKILKLELRRNDDGTAMLNHWDIAGGNDTVLRLTPDGDVHELSFEDDPEDETEIWTPVDLVDRLLAMVKE